MQAKIETLASETLQTCTEMGGSVVLVRVLSIRPDRQGTRGARVRIEFESERVLHGSSPSRAGFWSWGGPDQAHVGQRLIAALKAAPPDAKNVGLWRYVAIPEGQEEEAVRAHRALLDQLSTSKKQ